jgi:hypothetical protein
LPGAALEGRLSSKVIAVDMQAILCDRCVARLRRIRGTTAITAPAKG